MASYTSLTILGIALQLSLGQRSSSICSNFIVFRHVTDRKCLKNQIILRQDKVLGAFVSDLRFKSFENQQNIWVNSLMRLSGTIMTASRPANDHSCLLKSSILQNSVI